MTNTPAETKSDTLPIEELTPAENTSLSNEQAAVGALEVEKDLTSEAVSDAAAEETLEETPDIQAAEAKEAAPPNIPETVKDFIAPISEHLDAGQTIEALDGTGAEIVGETHPAHNLGQNEPSTLPAFNAVASGKYASGEGKPLEDAVRGRWQILKWAKIPKIFGGQKVKEETLNNTIKPQERKVG